MKMNCTKKQDLWSQINQRKKDVANDLTCEPQMFSGYPKARVLYLDKENWNDTLPQSELVGNDPKVLFIAAQYGVLAFLFNRCVPIALEKGKKVLYFCYNNASYEPLKEHAMKLNKCGVEITTYQEYIKDTSVFDPNDYAFVVLERCHRFVTRSTDDLSTEMTLQQIIAQFPFRIYLTDLPQFSLETIYKFEADNQTITVFHTDFNYNINPSFFRNIDDVLKKIREKSDESWLLWIDDEKKRTEVKEKLRNHGITYDSVSQDTNFCPDSLEQKAPVTDILIAEDIDSAINDYGVSNVVLFDYDIIPIQQIVNSNVFYGECLNLYLCLPTIEEVKEKCEELYELDYVFEEIQNLSERGGCFESIRPPFFICGDRLTYNKLYLIEIRLGILYYERMIDSMEHSKSEAEMHLAYAKYILSCLEGVNVNPVFLESHELGLES